MTRKNKGLVNKVLQYKYGKSQGKVNEALKKIEEVKDEQYETRKVDVAKELHNEKREMVVELFNKGHHYRITNKDIKVASAEKSSLGRYYSFCRYKGLVYVVFYEADESKLSEDEMWELNNMEANLGMEGVNFYVLGGKRNQDSLLLNPDTLKRQIEDFGAIFVRWTDDMDYIPRELVSY